MSIFTKALKVSWFYHNSQRRRDGQMYFFHPYRVSLYFKKDEDRAISLLHDLLEDCEVKITTLRKIFPKYVCDGVEFLTHKKEDSYFEYIKKIPDKYRKFKIADISDNFKTAKNQKKYLKALLILGK